MNETPLSEFWEIIPDADTYDRLYWVNPETNSEFDKLFRGERVSHLWNPIPVRHEKAEKEGDFPSLPGGMPPVFTRHALDVLYPFVKDDIEALPLECEEGELYAINVLSILDCLDHLRSDIETLPEGYPVRVRRLVLQEGCLGERHIFRLREFSGTRYYITDKLKTIIEQNGLEGLQFIRR